MFGIYLSFPGTTDFFACGEPRLSAAFQRLGSPAMSRWVSARHHAGQTLSQSLLVARAVLEKLKLEGRLEFVCPQKVDMGSDFKNPGQSSPRGVGERAPEEAEPQGRHF